METPEMFGWKSLQVTNTLAYLPTVTKEKSCVTLTPGVIPATNKECDLRDLNNSASVSPACSAPNVNKSNSFKRAKPARSKCPADTHAATPPPPPVPPHQVSTA
jgi:hypothetical protein